MTYREILDREETNADKIYLYREGMFLKAYEQSAFLCHTHVHPFKLSRRFIKSVNRHVISLGFPEASLKKWLWAFPVNELSEKVLVCEIGHRVEENELQQWRELAAIEANPGDRYTVHTSQIERTPLWKTAYDLLHQVLDISVNVSKQMREPFVNRLKTLVYEICLGIHGLYQVPDREAHIFTLLEKCREVMFLLQFLRDRREISAEKAFPLAAERIDSVGRQLEGLRRKAKAHLDGAGLNQQPAANPRQWEQ